MDWIEWHENIILFSGVLLLIGIIGLAQNKWARRKVRQENHP